MSDSAFFNPFSNKLVDEFHYQQRSNERIESMALNRRQSSEDYTFSNPTVEQGLTIEHQPTLSPLLIPGATAMPWMNYRNQNQTVPSSSSSYRQRDLTSTEISSTVVPSSSTTKSVSFDVQLTREEFLFQLSAKPEEYRVSSSKLKCVTVFHFFSFLLIVAS